MKEGCSKMVKIEGGITSIFFDAVLFFLPNLGVADKWGSLTIGRLL